MFVDTINSSINSVFVNHIASSVGDDDSPMDTAATILATNASNHIASSVGNDGSPMDTAATILATSTSNHGYCCHYPSYQRF